MLTYATETTFFAHRPFWFLVWAGVFERHPELTFVCTEQKADWVPTTLEYLDGIYAQRFFSHIRETVKHKPSEYWARQCHVGASFMTRDEVMHRCRGRSSSAGGDGDDARGGGGGVGTRPVRPRECDDLEPVGARGE